MSAQWGHTHAFQQHYAETQLAATHVCVRQGSDPLEMDSPALVCTHFLTGSQHTRSLSCQFIGKSC